MAAFTVINRTDLMFLQGVNQGDIAFVSSESLYYEFAGGDVANLSNWIKKSTDGRKYSGGIPKAVGVDVQSNRPWDERDIVTTKDDLKTLYNAYGGIEVEVEDEGYTKYRWNGVDQTNLDNWKIQVSVFYQIVGEDTVENIKLKSCTNPGHIWLTLDNGIDECGVQVYAGYGMACDINGRWCSIGRLTGVGVPDGGLVGQYLRKRHNDDFATEWEFIDSAEVVYDNSGSTLAADDVEEAIDELDGKINVLMYPPNIANFTYSGYHRYVEIPATVDSPLFTWTNLNSPVDVMLWDSDGSLNEDVTGLNQYQSSVIWSFNNVRTVNWYIEGTFTDRKQISTTGVYASYTGKNITGTPPTESEVLAGTKHVVPTNVSFTSVPNTTGTEYGWFAVHDGQTGAAYNEWYVDEFNNGPIDSLGFIRYAGMISVSGMLYQIYIYNYPSTLNEQIILR